MGSREEVMPVKQSSSSHGNIDNAEKYELLLRFFQAHPWVKFVQYRWVDYSGILRSRIAAKDHCLNLVAGGKPFGTARICFQCTSDNVYVPPGINPVGSEQLYPDWASLRATPSPTDFESAYATVMCAVATKELGVFAPESESICPRRALSNVLHTAKSEYDIDFLVGFEVEFMIMEKTESGEMKPLSNGYGLSARAGQRDPTFKIVEECLNQLLALGVLIESVHPEGRTRGQYEVSLGPLSPLEAVDQLVLVHDVIKSITSKHGLYATMSPKPAVDRSGNGQHTHVSINPPTHETAFLAGVLGRLKGLTAITLPYNVSYQRVKPFEGGSQVSWGTENRTTAFRKINPGHWEIRCVDALANMYFALAAIFSAGILGIRNNETLRWRDRTYVHKDESEEDKAWQNAPESQLPTNLKTALDHLEPQQEELQSVMGGKPVHHYLYIKRHEDTRMSKLPLEEVTQLFVELF